MAIKEDLQESVATVLRERWDQRDGQIVPDPEDLKLGNDAVNLKATILYADMADSTKLVNEESATRAAEFYKCYLACAARIIKNEDGAITAYDGDRVMAVFIGKRKNTTAVTTALKIRWAVSNILNPAIKKQYGSDAYQLNHVLGVDTSNVLVSRIGVRNDNDLVWVGRAANYAAKLSALPSGYAYITGDVFDQMHDDAKFGGNPRQSMWEERRWTTMDNMRIYRSSWTWAV